MALTEQNLDRRGSILFKIEQFNIEQFSLEQFKIKHLDQYVNEIIAAINIYHVRGFRDARYHFTLEAEKHLSRDDQRNLPQIIDQRLLQCLCELIPSNYKTLTKIQLYYVFATIELVGDCMFGGKAIGAVLAKYINYNQDYFDCAIHTLVNKINLPERIIDTLAETIVNTIHVMKFKMTTNMRTLLSYILLTVSGDTFKQMLANCNDIQFILEILDLYYTLSIPSGLADFKRVANANFKFTVIKHAKVSTILYRITEINGKTFDNTISDKTTILPNEAIKLFRAICRRQLYLDSCYHDMLRQIHNFIVENRIMARFLVLHGPEDILGQILHGKDEKIIRSIKYSLHNNKTASEHCAKVFMTRVVLTARDSSLQSEMYKRYPRNQDNLFDAKPLIQHITDFTQMINLF